MVDLIVAKAINKNPPLAVRASVMQRRWQIDDNRREAVRYQGLNKLYLSEDFAEGRVVDPDDPRRRARPLRRVVDEELQLDRPNPGLTCVHRALPTLRESGPVRTRAHARGSGDGVALQYLCHGRTSAWADRQSGTCVAGSGLEARRIGGSLLRGRR